MAGTSIGGIYLISLSLCQSFTIQILGSPLLKARPCILALGYQREENEYKFLSL